MAAAHHVDNDAVFAEKMRAKLKRTSIGDGVMNPVLYDLHNLLIMERRNVLFVGEGNFTFTVAFAALREHVQVLLGNISDPCLVWNGITSARYEPIQCMGPDGNIYSYLQPHFHHVKMTCFGEICRKSFINIQIRDYILSTIRSLPPPPCWYFGIDAGNIPLELIPQNGVIWFQCPWSNNVGSLVEDFLLNTAKRVCGGTYLCVGLLLKRPYFYSYSLERIIGRNYECVNNSTSVLKSCDYLGADDQLVKGVLNFGYRHRGRKDLHRYVLEYHITLVFRKKYYSSTSTDANKLPQKESTNYVVYNNGPYSPYFLSTNIPPPNPEIWPDLVQTPYPMFTIPFFTSQTLPPVNQGLHLPGHSQHQLSVCSPNQTISLPNQPTPKPPVVAYPRPTAPCLLPTPPHPRPTAPHPQPTPPHPRPTPPHPRPTPPPHPRPTPPHSRPTPPHPQSTAPHLLPTPPHPRPTAPHPQPTAPHPQPTPPHFLPTPPHPRPTAPHPQPTPPHPRPTPPHPRPTPPHPQPTPPHPQPTPPHPQPTAPHPQPTAPHPQPTAPHPQPTPPHPQPTAPHPQPTPPHPQPTPPHPQPTAPHPQPTPPHPQPTPPHPRPTAPHHKPTAPMSQYPRIL